MFPPEILITPQNTPIVASVRLPGSKSYTNRALVIAGLARGRSELEGALFSDDTVYMARGLRELGVAVEEQPGNQRFVVTGCAGKIPADRAKLFVGNSGTTARFLTAALALGQGEYELDGNPAMQTRPIGPLLSALRELGADVVSVRGNDCPPIRVRGHGLEGGRTRLPGNVSSQYFSALLLCGAYTRQGIALDVDGELVSKPYLEMTAQAMRAFGVKVEVEAGEHFKVPAGQTYVGTRYDVEPDASAASYFFGAAAVTGGRVVVQGLGSESLQGDLGFVRVLERMGCTVRQSAHQTEIVGGARLHGVEANLSDLSDTAPTLAAVAALAEGPTRITGIGFIRRKETDRIAAVVRELNRVGCQATEEPDGLLVNPKPLHGALIETYDDHRMAMSFSLIGLRTPGIVISNPSCVAKTFPDYFEVLDSSRGGGTEEP